MKELTYRLNLIPCVINVFFYSRKHVKQIICSILTLVFLSQAYATTAILKTIETDDCMITWIKSSSNEIQIVKQIKDVPADEQFLLVLDALACFIANQSNIPMNQVTLIPAYVPFIGKYYQDRIATLHTLAPGHPVSEYLPWPDFDIHQRFRKPGSPLWIKWGPLPSQKAGLTHEVISDMSRHPTLPKIVALDTFVGNADRSNPNIFYDSANQSFCGIDMAASFNNVLAEVACDQLNCLFNEKNLLSNLELQGLIIYYRTLRDLVDRFPLSQLHMLLDEFANDGGFVPTSALYNQDVQDRMDHHKIVIKENYHFSLHLLKILEKYLKLEAYADLLEEEKL